MTEKEIGQFYQKLRKGLESTGRHWDRYIKAISAETNDVCWLAVRRMGLVITGKAQKPKIERLLRFDHSYLIAWGLFLDPEFSDLVKGIFTQEELDLITKN